MIWPCNTCSSVAAEQFVLERYILDAHCSGNRCSHHCPFIADSLCSVGGIICGGRVASPGNVFHQLQLYRTLSIGVEMRVVKSPSSSFIHIRETKRRGAAHLLRLRCESECVNVCLCVTESTEHEVFPPSPTMRMDGPIMEGFNPWLWDWTITEQHCHRDIRKYESSVQRLHGGEMG